MTENGVPEWGQSEIEDLLRGVNRHLGISADLDTDGILSEVHGFYDPHHQPTLPLAQRENLQPPKTEEEQLYEIQKYMLERVYSEDLSEFIQIHAQREVVRKYKETVDSYKALLMNGPDYRLIPRINLNTLKVVADCEFKLATEALVRSANEDIEEKASRRLAADRWSHVQEIAEAALR